MAQKLESLLKQLKTLKEMKNCFESEEDEELLDSLICESLKLIQEIRIALCNNMDVRISTLKINRVFSDPSIQFFGIDWDSLFSKCVDLKQNIAALVDTSDSAILEEIVFGLLTIEDQILQHSVAVMSGNLEKKKLREREMMQRRVALMATKNTVNTSREERKSSSFHVITMIQSACKKFRSKH